MLEATCQNQTSAIQLLEEQKIDITDDLNTTKHQLESLKDSVKDQKETESVKSEIQSIEIEENLDKLKSDSQQLKSQFKKLQKTNQDLESKIEKLTEEKIELQVKLDGYINENMELLDKIEKLSMEKLSSAESIEMVENLTHQEKLEFEKSVHGKNDEFAQEEEATEISEELNDSLVKLREESSELMQKIELFTTERREVLEKLERREEENQSLKNEIEQLHAEKDSLQSENQGIIKKLEASENLLSQLEKEKAELSSDLKVLNEDRAKLQEEINKVVKEEMATSTHVSPAKSAPESPQGTEKSDESFNKEECEKLLKNLEQEIQNYTKNKDKNKKIQISKKLSQEAKHVHNLMVKLVQDYFKNSDEISGLKSEIEKLRSQLDEDRSGDDLRQNQAKLDELLQTINLKEEELQGKITEMSQKLCGKDQELIELKESLQSLENQIQEKDKFIENIESSLEAATKDREKYQQEINEHIAQITELRQDHDKLGADIKENKQNLNQKCMEVDELRHEFDMKLKTATNEVEILKTLVAEQKQLLIDSYQEHELDMNQKLEEIKKLQDEIETLKQATIDHDDQVVNQLKSEKLGLEKLLAETEQLLETNKDELNNKQETIDSLNNQIIELYKTMEDNANKLIEKDDELQYLQEINASRQDEIRSLHEKATIYAKSIADLEKKLNERNSEVESLRMEFLNASDSTKATLEKKVRDLEAKVSNLEITNKELGVKNKDQLDKLKKYAANLKKKTQHCAELEEKLTKLESGDQSKLQEYEQKIHLMEFENSKLSENLQQSSDDSNKISGLEREVQELKEKLDFVEEENWKLADQRKQAELEKLEIFKQFESINQQFHQMQESYASLEMIYQELSKNTIEMEAELKKSTQDLLVQDQLRKSLENELKKFHGQEEDSKKKTDKLKAAVVTLKNKLAEKKTKVDELEQVVQKLQDKSGDQEVLQQLQGHEQKLRENEEHLRLFYSQEIENLRTSYEEQENTLRVSYEQGLKNALEEELGKLTHLLENQSHEKENSLKNIYQQEKNLLCQEMDALKSQIQDVENSKLSLEGQLESVEQENTKLNEKIGKLEEAVSFVEARRNSLERQKKIMGQEFMEQTKKQEENEDVLLQRLNALTVQDELIEQKLRSCEEENLELSESLLEVRKEKDMLVQKVNELESELKKVNEFQEKVYQFEMENNKLVQQISQYQADLKRQQQEFQDKLKAKHSEIDEMEGELSNQLQKVENEKKIVQEALEKTQDQIVDFQDEVIRLKDQIHTLEQNKNDLERELSWAKLQNDNYTQDQLENQELRIQLMQDQSDLENLRQQNESMIQNHTTEINLLKQQINDLETMRSRVSQNQTDDQVELQNENQRLKESLEQYQQKTLQLQMALNAQQTDPFATITSKSAGQLGASSFPTQPIQRSTTPSTAQFFQQSPPTAAQFFQQSFGPAPAQPEVQSEDRSLEEQLRAAQEEIEKLRQNNAMMNVEFEAQSERINELTRANSHLQSQIQELGSIRESLMKSNSDLEITIMELQQQILNKNKELEEIKKEVEVLHGFTSQIPEQVTDDGKIKALENELLEKKEQIEKLHKTLERFEKNDRDRQTAALSTAIFFGESSETDSLFPVPAQPRVPVVEEICTAKRAFICHEDSTQTAAAETSDEWGWGGEPVQVKQENMEEHLRNYIKELEEKLNDLVALERNQSTELQIQAAKLLEYEGTIERLQRPANPLVQPEPMADNLAALEIEDGDGWCWGADGLVEQQQQQHQLQKSLLSPRSDLEVRLQEERDRVEALSAENKIINEELANLKEKSKKMMAKLKEYQGKIKESNKRGSSVESNLDLAIQEELNSQVQKLENRLKETQAEFEKELLEKQNLLKKIDVLSSANDKFTEMKERQDGQMELYQLKIKDLNAKLQKLQEWGDETEMKSKSPVPVGDLNVKELQKKIDDLTDQLKDQQVDFDEVQALLEEEKNNNGILENKIKKLEEAGQNENTLKDEKIENLERQLKDSNSQRDSFADQVRVRDAEIRDLISKIDLLSGESNNIKKILDELHTQNQLKTNQNDELKTQMKMLAQKNEELSKERNLYDKSVTEHHNHEVHELENQIQTLSADLQYRDAQILHLNDKIENLVKEDQTESLVQEILLKNQELVTLRDQVKSLQGEKTELENNLSLQLTQQLKGTSESIGNTADLKKRIQELEKSAKDWHEEKQQMEHELQVLNDQVLSSIAYEDKMKGVVLDLDAKNMEIQMLKSSLEQMKGKPDGNDFQKEKEKLEATFKTTIDTLNAQWSQKVEQKGSEISTKWREYCEAKEIEFGQIEADLRRQLEEAKTGATAEIVVEEETPDLDRSRSEEFASMKKIMEAQEIEIGSLKEQLALRSAELGQLAARVDPYRQMTSTNISLPLPRPDTVQVPRKEYDLLLYISEQREMRCAEMEMELRNLLGERDGLQLRLSNAIRQIEEVRRKNPDVQSVDASRTLPSESQQLAGPAVLSLSLDDADESEVQTKLSALSPGKQERGKTFREERARFERDLAHLPSEAKAEIVSE